MPPARSLDPASFDAAYRELILGGQFFEDDDYYVRERPRYEATLRLILERLGPGVDLSQLQMLEIGGGQIALLMRALFGCKAVIADVNPRYADSLTQRGYEFRVCDLLHDDLVDRDRFDLVVLCEVIEHMPVPPHQILRKVRTWMRPGGLLFLTTPNLYRLRNVGRMLLGMRVFDHFFIPERGQPIGHPLEYSAEHLSWQIEQAGFDRPTIEHRQLSFTGASRAARAARTLARPLFMRERLRDSLVASAHREG